MIACLGEALIDFKGSSGLHFSGFYGGSPYNVAIAAARLGAKTSFIGQVSSDFFGQSLRRYLQQNSVDTTYLLEHPAPSTLGFVTIDSHNQTHWSFMAQGAADTLYDPQPRPNLDQQYLQFGSISLLHDPTRASILELIKAHHQRSVIVLDPNCRPSLTPDRQAYLQNLGIWLEYVHIIKLSDQDLAWLEPNKTHKELADAWLARGLQLVVVTKGERGSSFYLPDAPPLEIAATPAHVVDTVGAGDTFTAALMVGLLEAGFERHNLGQIDTASLEPIARFASQAAALNCTKSGCQPPLRAEISRAEI